MGAGRAGRGCASCSTPMRASSFDSPGTGTSGATLRVYIEALETDLLRQRKDAQELLAPLIAGADELAGIRSHPESGATDGHHLAARFSALQPATSRARCAELLDQP